MISVRAVRPLGRMTREIVFAYIRFGFHNSRAKSFRFGSMNQNRAD